MKKNRAGFSALETVLVIVLIILLGVLGWYVWHQRHLKKANISATSAPIVAQNPKPPANPYAGWNTYTSSTEKASFKYPPNWQVINGQHSNVPGADTFAIQSPDGAVKVQWVSEIDGLGGGCDTDCPKIHFISSAPISGAPGLRVVTGTTTNFGDSSFQPWIAVQDSNGITADIANLNYATFKAINNKQEDSILSTGGSFYLAGPKLSQAVAGTWFNGNYQKQASLILSSLTYQ